MRYDVGDRLVDCLMAAGVDAIFGVPGGQTFPLYRAARSRDLRHVIMRDERGGACAADAFARVTGRIGVCDATVGPGVTNLISGLAEAFASATPLLAVIGDVAAGREHLRRRSVSSQAMDQRALMEPVCKWVVRVERPEALDAALDQALRIATTGRPGPVAIEIPEDVFRSPCPDEGRVDFQRDDGSAPRFRSRPTESDLLACAALLEHAERPLILAGGGVLASHAETTLEEFCSTHGVPVVTTVMGKGSVDETSLHSLGVVGTFGRPGAGRALIQADVVLVLGSKLDQQSTFSWKLPSPAQHVIRVDLDGEEIGRGARAELGILADAREFLIALTTAITSPLNAAWANHLQVESDDGAENGTDGRVDPRRLVEIINQTTEPGDLLVADASLASGWAARFHVQGTGRGLLAPRGLAGLGWSAGAAVGARLGAEANRKVIVLSGDGGWAFSMAEIETAVRVALPMIFVILNNSALGWVKHYAGADELGPEFSTFGAVDFAMVARGLGAQGLRARTVAEFEACYREACSATVPTLIDVDTSVTATPATTFRQARALVDL